MDALIYLNILKNAFASAPEPTALLNESGQAVFVNHAWCELLGGENSDAQRLLEGWQQQNFGETLVLKNVQGQPLLGKLHIRRIEGEVVFLCATLHDLTLQATLQKRNALFEVVTALLDIGWWEYDPVANRSVWSDSLAEIFEVQHNKTFDGSVESVDALIHPDDRAEVHAIFQKALQNQQPYNTMYRVVMADGRIKHIAEKGQLFVPMGETTPRMIGVLRDATHHQHLLEETNEARTQLKKQRDFYESILNKLPIDIAVFSPDLKYLFVNPVAIRSADTRAWVIGKDNFDYCAFTKNPLAIAERRDEVLREAIARRAVLDFEESLTTRTGEKLWFIRYVSPIYDESGHLEILIGYGLNITKRKNAELHLQLMQERVQELNQQLEEKVKARTQQLQEVTAFMPGVVYQFKCSPDGKETFTYISEGMERLYNIHTEAIYQNFELLFERIHPEDAPVFAAYRARKMQDALAGKDFTEFLAVVRVVRPTGELRWLRVNAVPKPLADGSVLWNGNIFDITESKVQEERVLTLSRTHQAILDSTDLAIISTDSNGIIQTFNKGAERMLGYKAAEIIGIQTLLIFHDPDELCLYVEQLRRETGTQSLSATDFEPLVAKSLMGISQPTEWLHVRKDGTRFPAMLTVNTIHDDKGNVLGHVGITQDYTERKKAELEMRIKEAAIDGSLSPIAIGDLRGNVTYVNQAFLNLWRMTLPEALATPASDFWASSKEEAEYFVNGIARNGKVSGERRAKRTDGTQFDVMFYGNVVKDQNGKLLAIMVSIQDIGEMKAARIKLERQNLKLQRQNEELEQFAYIASHDLQEPLRNITSFVELIERRFGKSLDPLLLKYLHYVRNAAARMRELVYALLQYARIGKEPERSELNCNQVVASVIADMRIAIVEKQAKIKIGLLPTVKGYKVELRQLFQNLISNAIKFQKPNVAPQIEIQARETPAEWVFSLKDNGIGISKEYQDTIFVIFKRLHKREEYDGVGIGLAQCKKIVTLHNGRIWLESEQGEGTTFYFSIPK